MRKRVDKFFEQYLLYQDKKVKAIKKELRKLEEQKNDNGRFCKGTDFKNSKN